MLQRRWFPDRIEGNRVRLRRHERENIAAFQRWYADPEVARLTRYQDGPMRPEEIERFFAVRALGPESLAMAIHVRETDRLIGTCAFSQLDADNGSALFHITIGERDTWSRGYGSEATSMMVDHAFRVLGLHRVALAVFAFNERAIRAYLRVGFVIEGQAREAIWRDGRWWDEVQMSILESDWRARQRDEERPGGDALADDADRDGSRSRHDGGREADGPRTRRTGGGGVRRWPIVRPRGRSN
jgi:RimJ/RimL family protein N-acetyltransferase